jgi:hypothetical protein
LQQHAGATARSIAMLESLITPTRASKGNHSVNDTDHQPKTKTEPVP